MVRDSASGCLFCRIVAGTAPAEVVFRDELVTAFRDNRPRAPSHILIVPNEHFDSVADIALANGELLAHMFAAANEVARREGVDRDGFRLVINRGPNAGQPVDHLHVHLLGGRRLHWPPG